MNSADFVALNKLRGLSPRQRRLLELEAVYRGTQYEGLPDWEIETADTGDGRGVRALCGHERNPRLKAGIIEEKVETIVDMAVGEGRFPSIEINDADVAKLIEGAKLSKRARGVLRDQVVKGAMVTEIARAGERLELRHLRPEWCEPVFVAHVGRPRALQLANELAEQIEGLGTPPDGGFLEIPEGARGDELAFLRYEYLFHAEEAVAAGARSETVAWWYRVDFTPSATIYYDEVKVTEDSARPEAWKVREVEAHGFGVVPVVWIRGADAEDGESEGPSLITVALRSISEAADRAMTRKDESVAIVANPKSYTIDLEDLVANYNVEAGKPAGWSASSSEVLAFQSRDGKGGGKIGLLELQGPGPKAAKEHFDDLVAQASRVSRVMAHDPQKAAEVQSGASLERMMEPTLQRVGAYLVSLGEWIEEVVAKTAIVFGHAPPKVKIAWPPRIRPTSDDVQKMAGSLTTATGGAAVMSQEEGVRQFAAVLGVQDVDAEVEAVTADADSAMQRARDALGSTAKASGEVKLAAAPPKAQAPVADVAKTALNGAQVGSLLALAESLAKKSQPPEGVRAMILLSFPEFDPALVDKMVAAYTGFTPAESAEPEKPAEKIAREEPGGEVA